MKRIICVISVLTVVATSCLFSQSGYQYRRSAVMNGNQVRTVFGNWGVIGQPTDTRPKGAWKNDNNGYLGDVSPFFGAEVKWGDTTFRSVETCPVARPTSMPDQSPTGQPWTMEPVSGYFNSASTNQSVAMSNNQNSWPTLWPDQDPTWSGIWNGYFGKRKSADLETYFVMDDNDDQRFNFANNNSRGIAFKPDSMRASRYGLGLVVKVRALQWSSHLAQDNIFWLYEINNTGTTNYDRAVFGMLVGTYHGVTGSADYGEWDDDWSFYDAQTNITYTGDFPQDNRRNPRWVGNADGLVGYAFLESPGNPYDGIDNDGDADSSLTGMSTPRFTALDFQPKVVTANQTLISIQNDFTRVTFTVPVVDSFKAWTRGMKDSVWLVVGRTRLQEGNTQLDVTGNTVINPNAYDGIDNNFNGLIDENQFVHFVQYKTNRNPPHQVLFNDTVAQHYRVALTADPYSLIDERRDDLIDNNRNWDVRYDDLGVDGIGPLSLDYPGPDCGEGDGKPTSGYDPICNPARKDFPGEPHIDKTDVNESDQIGLTSFFYFTPAGQIALGNKEQLWTDMAPGFFDVPASINYQPGIGSSVPINGEDGDFIYGSGYFPLVAKGTERFSLALVYGGGRGGKGTPVPVEVADLLKNKKTVQRIYDANYQFPQPPAPPTLTAVPGDHKVTLYWDRAAEATIDPVLRIKHFEGYKVYRSTNPDFSDIFTITDATGTPVGYQPLAQYDLKDGVYGFYRPDDPQIQNDLSGFSYYLGSETGLEHSYTDSTVDNGRRYYYAVVAYSFGDAALGVEPAENTHSIRLNASDQIESKDINVQMVVPHGPTPGFTLPNQVPALPHVSGAATGTINFSIVDEKKLKDHKYKISFLDTEDDGIDNVSVDTSLIKMRRNGKIDKADTTEWERVTSFYFVEDLDTISTSFVSQDTINVQLPNRNLIRSTVVVKNSTGGIIDTSRYDLDTARGTIRSTYGGSLPAGSYSITYRYYPIYRNPYIQRSPFVGENGETDVFDGVHLQFNNDWNTKLIDAKSGWRGISAYVYNFTPLNFPKLRPPLIGYHRPADYQIRFSSTDIDTSIAYNGSIPLPAQPVKFSVFNTTENTKVKFYWFKGTTSTPQDIIAPFDEIYLVEPNPNGVLSPTWRIIFIAKLGDPADTIYALGDGDTLALSTYKPFNSDDAFDLQMSLPHIDAKVTASLLENCHPVPNPYVTASSLETGLPAGITSGRGARRIDFIHVPKDAKISIYTSRGDHVITLNQDGTPDNGTVTWNLRTKENLDIAFGVYFYVVESSVGNKTGKLAIIK